MPFPAVRVSRNWFPALIVTALFHVLVIVLLITAMPKRFERIVASAAGRETITYLPLLAAPPEKKKRTSRGGSSGSRPAVTYFNPDAAKAAPNLQPNTFGLQTALSACAPENYDMASAEVRTVCAKIGALLTNDRGHFGVAQDVADPKHWHTELARKEAPYLAPCMSSKGVGVSLGTLLCVYDILMHGYNPENRGDRYSE